MEVFWQKQIATGVTNESAKKKQPPDNTRASGNAQLWQSKSNQFTYGSSAVSETVSFNTKLL